ncbi:MAG: hypothetical protein LQ341_006306 [Variospora aurantia]|nr:MAG: hypothetical protein LQ341_006306 [Variospora aurantia]
MAAKGKHALVFGASGLIGWGVVDQLLSNYPAQGTFSTVSALVNRPLRVEDSFWPERSPATPDLQLVSGVNLAGTTIESLEKLLLREVRGIENVTHVFYFVLKSEDQPEDEVLVNRKMLECAVGALNNICPNLDFLVFPSGTKAYGIHIPGGVFTAPFEESMGPLPDQYQNSINYPALRTVLETASAGRQWSWCDILPDAVIGFVPNGSAFNLTAHWATYLSLYALVHGKGARVPFPGTPKAYASLYNEASAATVAKCAIWAALPHPDRRTTRSGQTFNIADRAEPGSMSERWPVLAAYFGLRGVAPPPAAAADDDEDDDEEKKKKVLMKPGEFIMKHRHVLEEAKGVRGTSAVFRGDFLDGYGYHLDFDRQLSLEKVQRAGFTEEVDPNESWTRAFEMFKAAVMIVVV